MCTRFAEPLLNEPIPKLGLSSEFTIVCELAGLISIADLLERHSSELLKLPGFSYHLLAEYIDFLEVHLFGHYIDQE
jgi:hypothetical protein